MLKMSKRIYENDCYICVVVHTYLCHYIQGRLELNEPYKVPKFTIYLSTNPVQLAPLEAIRVTGKSDFHLRALPKQRPKCDNLLLCIIASNKL